MGASHSRQAVEASYGPRVKQCIRNRKQFIADIEEANTISVAKLLQADCEFARIPSTPERLWRYKARVKVTFEPDHGTKSVRIVSVPAFYRHLLYLRDIWAGLGALEVSTASLAFEAGNEAADEVECQICMDELVQVALPCGHSFCLDCLQDWRKAGAAIDAGAGDMCPMCRQSATSVASSSSSAAVARAGAGSQRAAGKVVDAADEMWMITGREGEDSYLADLATGFRKLCTAPPSRLSGGSAAAAAPRRAGGGGAGGGAGAR